MILWKVFKQVYHDLINVKLAPYGLSSLKLTLSYLHNRQKCVEVNDIRSNFKEVISSGTEQKMEFSIKDFFSKCDQNCSFLLI